MFKKMWVIFFCLFAMSARAAQLVPDYVDSVGLYNNETDLLVDGVVPDPGSAWNGADKVWWGNDPELPVAFFIGFNAPVLLQEMLISVDNNDDYVVDYFDESASSWVHLFTVGSAASVTGGLTEIFSSDASSLYYLATTDFASVTTSNIRIRAEGGDGLYSIGEVQFFGVSAVPETSNGLMFSAGLMLLGLIQRKKFQR